MICSAVMDWISAPNMSDGDLATYPVAVATVGKDGQTFTNHFPSEAGWMSTGDQYYTYVVTTAVPSNPVVTGTGITLTAIYGETVQAGGTGVPSGEDLSGCRANVEVVSGSY